MTEVERFCQLLARRCQATEVYGTVELGAEDGGFTPITLHLTDADVMLFTESVKDGRVKSVLSYLLPNNRLGVSLHLNGWRRPDGDTESITELVTAAWAKLWKDEERNRELGRLLWMHGSTIPEVEIVEPTPPPDDPIAELLSEIHEREPPVSRRKPVISIEDVFSMFGED